MKQLLIAILLFFSVSSYAQVYQQMSQYGVEFKRMDNDSVTRIPRGLGSIRSIPGYDTAQLRYNIADSSVYVHTGNQWIKAVRATGGTSDNIWTGLNTFRKNGIGTTITNALLLDNTTASTSENPQGSPALEFSGTWYNTTAATSNQSRIRIFDRTFSAVNPNNPAELVIQTSFDGTTFKDAMTIFAGNLDPIIKIMNNGQLEANNIKAASGSFITFGHGIYCTGSSTSGITNGLYIGGNPGGIASSAIFHISSTSKGSIPFPKMTSSQRTSVSSPVAGLLVYDTDLKRLCWYDNSQWNWYPTVSTGTAAPATTPAAVGDTYIDTTNKKIYTATGTSSSSDWTILN